MGITTINYCNLCITNCISWCILLLYTYYNDKQHWSYKCPNHSITCRQPTASLVYVCVCEVNQCYNNIIMIVHVHMDCAHTIEPEIFVRRNFLPILPPGLVGKKFVPQIFLSCVNCYIEHVVTFTILLAKIYSIKYPCNIQR